MSTKPSPYEAFRDNFSDAEALLLYARVFKNERKKSMRTEVRSKVGTALNVRVKDRGDLDWLRNKDITMVFMPGGDLNKDMFLDIQPLLRQSLVAACAALETYIADMAMAFVGAALQLEPENIPPRMRNISLTVGHWADIEKRYKRRKWGIRDIIDEHIRETSSTAPSSIGFVLSTIGFRNWERRVDGIRNVDRGTTNKELEAITNRRNLIAHTADRKGRSRASTNPEQVEKQLSIIKEVVDALDKLLAEHTL